MSCPRNPNRFQDESRQNENNLIGQVPIETNRKMRNERLACLLIVIQVILVENMADSQKNSFLSKLFNYNTQTRNDTFRKPSEYEQIVSEPESKCRHKCLVSPRYAGANQGTNSSEKNKQMEAPSSKYSFLNMFAGEEEDDDDDDDNDDHDIDKDGHDIGEKIKEKEVEEEEEEEEEDDGMSFFDEEEDEINSNKVKDEDDESLLKQYHRHRLRLHNMVFPLLLAYKLKFFTVIPLLLGSLVLLVGTTGVAGFFFALFAAALGLHVKSTNHPPHHH